MWMLVKLIGKKIGKFMIDFDFEYVILNYMFNVVIV